MDDFSENAMKRDLPIELKAVFWYNNWDIKS